MNYFEKRFQQIYEKFLFSLKIYHGNPTHCETCYRDCLNEMDSLFYAMILMTSLLNSF